MVSCSRIIESDPWLDSPAGRYLLGWEQAQVDRIVADIFGFHALQVGRPALDALRANRMPHRWRLNDQPWPGPHHARVRDPGMAPELDGAETVPGLVGAPPSGPAIDVLAEFEALPFPSQCLDLVVLPHTLELAADAHQTLREVERVLMPEGRVVVIGFNPASLWSIGCREERLARRLGLDTAGLGAGSSHAAHGSTSPNGHGTSAGQPAGNPQGHPSQQGHQGQQGHHDHHGLRGGPGAHANGAHGANPTAHPNGNGHGAGGELIGPRRLRDWFRLLGLQVETGRFGCYRPPWTGEAWLQRNRWMERAGERWWPFFGSVYVVTAVKRVRGMRLISPAWKQRRVAATAPAVLTPQRQGPELRPRAPLAMPGAVPSPSPATAAGRPPTRDTR